jgi:hypothetical protein
MRTLLMLISNFDMREPALRRDVVLGEAGRALEYITSKGALNSVRLIKFGKTHFFAQDSGDRFNEAQLESALLDYRTRFL